MNAAVAVAAVAATEWAPAVRAALPAAPRPPATYRHPARSRPCEADTRPIGPPPRRSARRFLLIGAPGGGRRGGAGCLSTEPAGPIAATPRSPPPLPPRRPIAERMIHRPARRLAAGRRAGGAAPPLPRPGWRRGCSSVPAGRGQRRAPPGARGGGWKAGPPGPQRNGLFGRETAVRERAPGGSEGGMDTALRAWGCTDRAATRSAHRGWPAESTLSSRGGRPGCSGGTGNPTPDTEIRLCADPK